MNLKKLTEGKAYGFYVSVAMILLSVITAIVYVACFAGEEKYHIMNYGAFAFMLIGAVAGIVLLVLKKYEWVPYILGGCAFIGLLLFIYGIYYYCSVVFVGIDLHEFSPESIINMILFFGTTILGVVNVFLPQIKKEKQELVESEAK